MTRAGDIAKPLAWGAAIGALAWVHPLLAALGFVAVLTGGAVRKVFFDWQRNNDCPRRHARMAARWTEATGLGYPDKHGRIVRVVDHRYEDAA